MGFMLIEVWKRTPTEGQGVKVISGLCLLREALYMKMTYLDILALVNARHELVLLGRDCWIFLYAIQFTYTGVEMTNQNLTPQK